VITAIAISSIVVFIAALWAFGVARVGAGVLATAQGAVAAMRDESLDDEAREKVVQRASIQLMGAFASILVRGALTFLASILPIWLGSLAGLAEIEEVMDYLSRCDVILIASVVITAGFVIWMRLWRSR
jgi:hypothetical protein